LDIQGVTIMNVNRKLDRVPLEYSQTARRFHWWTAGAVILMLILGEAMTYRGNTLNVWDATTNNLYSAHKLIGFLLLFVVIARLTYRVRNGAPPDEPTLEWWQKAAAHLTHWGLYALLIAMPIGGWIGVQLYPSREIFGLFNLPAFLAPNQKLAETVLMLHGIGAKLIVLLLLAHVGAAIFHHFIRKDGVLRRMWPGLSKR
jgi:cytochrome b561